MKRISHSKFKNTGLLFELLVRQVTTDIFNEKSDSVAINMIKKYFGKNKPLSKELKLYKTLMETKYSSESKAKELLEETLSSRSRLNNASIKKEKYNIIKELQEKYDMNDFFKNKLSTYKELASIYKLFELKIGNGELFPEEIIQCKDTLVDKIINIPHPKTDVQDIVFEEYRKQSADLKKLAYKILIEKFNEKYSSLDARQKNLLREFIYNSADVSSFRSYVNTQIDEVKSEISNSVKEIKDKNARIKVNGVLEHINKLKQTKGIISDDHLVQLMKYFELNKEIQQTISAKEKVNG